jgi:hypothetical protein
MFSFGSTALRAADGSQEVQKAAILTTMTEAALAAASLIQDRTNAKLERVSWSATYSERDWAITVRGTVNGEPCGFTMSGYLWGADKEDWLVSYSGLGEQRKEPIRINGKAVWQYDSKVSDHVAMDFQQNIKFGDNSMWGWVLGAEVIVGGTVGGGAAIVTAGLATGGIALGASAVIGAWGALGSAAALVGASSAAKSLIEDNHPPPAPPAPERPAVPKNGEKLSPQKGMIYTVVSHGGTISGSGPDGILLISGKFGATTATGTITERSQ